MQQDHSLDKGVSHGPAQVKLCPLKNMLKSLTPGPVNVTSGNRVVADVISWGHTRVGWAFTPIWLGSTWEETQTHKGESHVTMEADWSTAAANQRMSAWKLGRPKVGLCPPGFRESIALWFQTSSIQKCETMHFCCFCGLLLRQPWKTNMWLKDREVADALRQTRKGELAPLGSPSALFLFLTADHHFLLFGQHSPWSFPLPSCAGMGHQAVQSGLFFPYYQELNYD